MDPTVTAEAECNMWKTNAIAATAKAGADPQSRAAEDASAPSCECDSPRPGARVGRHLPLLPAVALILLPKCPLCLAAWLGVFSFFGAGTWLSAVWGMPLAAGLLSFTVGALALRAWRSRDGRPLATGVLGSAALLAGKCLMDMPLLICLGLGMLIGASLWSIRIQSLQTSRNSGICTEI